MSEEASAQIWMGDISSEMDKAFVIESFANMGFTALDVKEMTNRDGDRANYCFVNFGDINIAREVLIKVNGEPIPGTSDKKFRLNRCEFGKGGVGAEVEHSMYVRDLTPDVTDEQLLEFFQSKYSSVRAANVVKDAMGVSKGFGFVRFFNEEQYSRALRQQNGASGLGQKPLRVNVASKTNKKTKGQSSGEFPNDPSNMPKWMKEQMEYVQQMQQYMQQCHQFAQQAAAYAGWNQQHQPPPPETRRKTKVDEDDVTDAKTFMSLVEKEHAKMLSETAEIEEDQELVEFDEPVDVAALNQEIIDRDDKFFMELEAARWDFETCYVKAHEQTMIKAK